MAATPRHLPLPNYTGVSTAVREAEQLAREHKNYTHYLVGPAVAEALHCLVVSAPLSHSFLECL